MCFCLGYLHICKILYEIVVSIVCCRKHTRTHSHTQLCVFTYQSNKRQKIRRRQKTEKMETSTATQQLFHFDNNAREKQCEKKMSKKINKCRMVCTMCRKSATLGICTCVARYGIICTPQFVYTHSHTSVGDEQQWYHFASGSSLVSMYL